MSKMKADQNRMPAQMDGKFTICCICFARTTAIHYHHTVPQALGGEDSLQIPICGDCHTTLHSKGDACVAFLKGNRTEPVGNFWHKQDDELRAEPYLQILVNAMLNPPVTTKDKMVKVQPPKVDMITRAALDLLKIDLPGVTNLTQTIDYCIQYTLQSKGYKNEEFINKKKTNYSNATSTRHNQGSSDLWGMCGTKRGRSDKPRRSQLRDRG